MRFMKRLLLPAVLVGVVTALTARLALSPFWDSRTPAECARAYADARSLGDTHRVDLLPLRGAARVGNHRCGETRASHQDSLLLASHP